MMIVLIEVLKSSYQKSTLGGPAGSVLTHAVLNINLTLDRQAQVFVHPHHNANEPVS